MSVIERERSRFRLGAIPWGAVCKKIVSDTFNTKKVLKKTDLIKSGKIT